ncbi:hypothetical protein CVT24_012073 [Panaeolus cyanescens]|uniref:RING-type domain-containing protein n=1 Tax=Panaeolus cyanescens TaxID=181874 RepID=A0A409YNG0_9AGAR|nr:hypothetical protein CVT24_012073 [Panaeolus cyanescens]
MLHILLQLVGIAVLSVILVRFKLTKALDVIENKMDRTWDEIMSLDRNMRVLQRAVNVRSREGQVLHQIKTHLECPICSTEMRRPYALPNCGHTFCQNCLKAWFETKRAEFIALYPSYRDEHLNVAHALSVLLDYYSDRPGLVATHRSINALRRAFPEGCVYQCPVCRTHISCPPVEAVAMKKLVRELGVGLMNWDSYGPNVDAEDESHPWDHFFPRRSVC